MNYERYQSIQNKLTNLCFDNNGKESNLYVIKEVISDIDEFTRNQESAELFIDKLMGDKMMLISKMSEIYFDQSEYDISLNLDEFLFSINSNNITLLKRMLISYSNLGMIEKANIIDKFIKKKFNLSNTDKVNESLSTMSTTLNELTIVESLNPKSKLTKDTWLMSLSKVFGYSLLGMITLTSIRSVFNKSI